MKQQRFSIVEILLVIVAIGGFVLAGLNFATTYIGRAEASAETIGLVEDGAMDDEEMGEDPFEFDDDAVSDDEDAFMPESDADDEDADFDDEESMANAEDDDFESEDDEEMGEVGEEYEFDLIDTLAQQTGLDYEEIEQAILQGQSLAQIADSNGGDANALVDALIAHETVILEQELQSGELDAAAADEWREEMRAYAVFTINTPYLEPEVIIAQQLGIEPEQIWEALESGSTVATLASQANIPLSQLGDAVIASETAYFAAMVDAGLVDGEEQTEFAREVNERVANLLTLTLAEMEALEASYEDE